MSLALGRTVHKEWSIEILHSDRFCATCTLTKGTEHLGPVTITVPRNDHP
jgi:hypothetical protein